MNHFLPASPEPVLLASSDIVREDEQIPQPRRRRHHPNGIQLPPPISDGRGNDDNGHVFGRQFVEYFTIRRANEGARWCVFVCCKSFDENLVETFDVPLTADELNNES